MRTVIPIAVVKAEPAACAEQDGWARLSTLSEPRLSEMAENYRALGYEVDVRDVQRTDGGCNTCFDAGKEMGQVFGTLYVRRRPGTAPDKELFD
ncbi:conserved hypothetical protein [Burkholderiales bacterium]|nr:conserved hypothetical protein [Burkholderiales bacterium]